jgi:Fe-S oxidoreductase
MVSFSYIDAFIPEGKDSSQCATCGVCLQKCPVMKMDKDQSRSEIMKLINGEDTERVLNECTFCFTCNHYCPQGLKPYFLIMERMTTEYRDGTKEIPEASSFMMTGKSDNCFTYNIYNALPDDEKAILDKWTKVPPKAKDTLFLGCDGRTVPASIEHSKVLSSLPKFGPRDACCGEMAYRLGDIETFDNMAKRTFKYLESLDTERLVCYCGSCASTIINVWSCFYDFKLPFKVITLYEWLWEKYQAGELTVQRTDPRKIAVSDCCYGSEMGEVFYKPLRALYDLVGMSQVELENARYDNACCGVAVMLRDDMEAMGKQVMKKAEQIMATKLPEVVCNCPGCYTSLNQGVAPQGVKVRFALNEILWAFGDDTKDLKRKIPSGETV